VEPEWARELGILRGDRGDSLGLTSFDDLIARAVLPIGERSGGN
jgi:hypothetical protein